MAFADRILAAKMAPPRLGFQLLDRPRLWESFDNYHVRKLTLISAPPGYGKTVLLSQFANRSQGHIVWYQLDPLDNDLAFFFQNITAVIAKQLPGFEPEILNLVERSPDLSRETRRIAALMSNILSATLDDEFVLIIDDYHSINEPAIDSFMESLLEYLPDKVHIVLAGRTKPAFNLNRLRLSGLVKELGPEELRFNHEEVSAFLQGESCEPVLDKLVTLLEEKTAGWPAALRLASLSMESTITQKGINCYRKLLNNLELYKYLATEVMEGMTDEIADFLYRISIFDFFTVKICDLFLGQESSLSLLETVDRMNLFSIVQEGDEMVYSFHPLFREFLQSRLSGDRGGYLKKAGECYRDAGYPVKAVEFFLQSNDFNAAISVVEEIGAAMLLHSQWQTVKRWLGKIPDDLKSERPWLKLYEGAASLNSGQLELAAKKINEAEATFKAAADIEGLLQAKLYQARLLRSKGQYQESIDLLENLLPELTRQKVSRWYGIILEYSLNSILQGRFAQTAHILDEALKMAEEEDDTRIVGQLTESLGFLYYCKGNFSKALEIYQRAEEVASDDDRFSFSLRDSVAAIYYDWGDLEQALEYAQANVEEKERFGMMEALPYAYKQVAMILADMGKIIEAEEKFKYSINLAEKLGGETFFQALSMVVYGRFLSSWERFEEARVMAERALKLAEGQTEFIYALTLVGTASVYLDLGELEMAREMLHQSLEYLEAIGSKDSMFIASAHLAAVYRRTGDEKRAEELAVQSLNLAAAGYYLQLFLSRPDIMLPVVRTGLVRGVENEFINEVLNRLGKRSEKLLLELVDHEDPLVRRRIMTPMALVGGKEMCEALKSMLRDNDEEVRDLALSALQELSSPDQKDLDQGAPEKFLITSAESEKDKLYIQCLGPFQVIKDEKEVAWRTVRARDLFAYLVHNRGKPVSREMVWQELWPDVDPDQAVTLFHTNLYHLRRAVRTGNGKQPVKYKGKHYHLDQELYTVDVKKFESLASEGDNADRSVLEKAISLYQGDYLEGLDYPWAYAERERLNRMYLNILNQLSKVYLEEECLEKAASCLRTIIRLNPLLEESHAILMQIYARMGDRLSVIQQYETLVSTLNRELGVSPTASTRNLYYRLCSDEE